MKTTMPTFFKLFGAAVAVLGIAASCVTMDDDLSLPGAPSQQKINFDVLVTRDKQLQGMIHLRKLTATNVASAGDWETHIYENNDDF